MSSVLAHRSAFPIYKYYTQLGKVDRLRHKFGPLAALFGLSALYTCQHLTLPASSASLHRRRQSKSL